MKVLFDLTPVQPTSQSPFHGGGEYTKSLFRHLLASGVKEELVAAYNPDLQFDPSLQDLVNRKNVALVAYRRSSDLYAILGNGNFRRFYSALPRIGHTNFGATEFMFTLHGLRVLEMPADRYESRFVGGTDRLKAWLKLLRPTYYVSRQRKVLESLITTPSRRTTIITDSYHSKYAILYFYPFLDADQVKVFYAPPTAIQGSADSPPDPMVEDMVKEKYGLEQRGFFLLVSAKQWRKNAYRAVRAIDEVYSSFDVGLKTLVLGCDDSAIFSVKNKERFVFAPYTSEEELVAIYRAAFCLVYPSLNEGFGYPPLESMAFGTPVICSSATSLPEVCGDAVLYFNPYSSYELKNRILHLLFEPGAWKHYSHRGNEYAKNMRRKQEEALDQLCNLILSE